MRDIRIMKREKYYAVQDFDKGRKQIGKKFTNKRDAFVFLNQIIAGTLKEEDFKKYFYALKYRHLLKK
jgi:hypothetical protein